ncbi:helix-turn-helix domain-containing protein [Carnobacterium maltaromaticum]|uniref:helix-turn-helix domain-containing protein n=1 Tax=Carnobacterium maltaromaticum TaxID=2751 RepID=UPI00399097B9
MHVYFSSDFSLESVYDFYMNTSIRIDLCLSIFKNNYTTIENFAEKHRTLTVKNVEFK